MRKILFGLMILAVLVLSGCGGQQKEQQTVGRTFIGGTTGLTMEFIAGSPPDEVFDQGQQPFAIDLKVENKGEWPIDNPADLSVTIVGLYGADWNNPVMKLNAPQAMQAATLSPEGNIIPGSIVDFFFEGFSYTGKLAGTSQDLKFEANACYKYGTRATAKACVRQNLLTTEAGICKVTEDKLVENSGAPVQISTVKEGALGKDKISLTFTIKQADTTGAIYQKGSGCPAGTPSPKKDKVYLKVNTGIAGVTCTGLQNEAGAPITGAEGYITLFNGERIVNCQQTIATPGDFEKVVEITVEYDYKQSLTKTLKVKKSTVG